MKHLLKHFKTLTKHPKNAEELKGLILQLAIQGKLTENWRQEYPNVESAFEVLQRSASERAQLIAEKKIKKEKALSIIEDEEELTDIPESWQYEKLGNIGDWGAGATPLRSRGDYYGGKINWFKSGELNNSIMDYESKEKITELALEKTSVRLNKPGDVLIAMYGATIGKTGLLQVSGTTNQAVCACTPFLCITSSYLHLLLKGLKQVFLNQGEGGAQPNISRVKIRNQVFALPPLEEQKAIVAIVNELFKEVEQLEDHTKTRIQLKEDFVSSALRRLSETENVHQEWLFLQTHFTEFFTQKANVKQLRETILQLAVQGKLTTKWRSQNPNTEPASELLKRIQTEKQQLIAQKKIKKEKPLPPIEDHEKPYELPEGWVWCRFAEIVINRDGERKPITKSNRVKGPYDYYGASGVIDKVENYIFDKDLLLIGEDGANLINRSTPIAFFARGKYWVNNHAHVLDATEKEILEYLEVYINSINLEDYITGMAQPKMPQKRMNIIPVPLPSIEEQKAIVNQVNTLMALCDSLEEHIENSQTQIEQLMQSCLREVFEN